MYTRLVILIYIGVLVVSCGCNHNSTNTNDVVGCMSSDSVCNDGDVQEVSCARDFCEIVDSGDLKIIFPDYSKVDLVCGSMPSKNDSSVIFVAAAAYTGECLDSFVHKNVAGDHVCNGKRYKGYKCRRNTGAFVFYNNKWKFCYQQYSNELDSAAKYGGMAFAQELIIADNKSLPTTRADKNKNKFRVLCELSGKLCVVESTVVVEFGNFKRKLMEMGVSNAIYMDMGTGWNHAWYRTNDGVNELHPKTHNFCTNWITFYK